MVLAHQWNGIITTGRYRTDRTGSFRIRDRSFVNGDPVISLSVRRQSGSTSFRSKQDMMAEVALINDELPASGYASAIVRRRRGLNLGVQRLEEPYPIGALQYADRIFPTLLPRRLLGVRVFRSARCSLSGSDAVLGAQSMLSPWLAWPLLSV
jgi:hypothetical protein